MPAAPLPKSEGVAPSDTGRSPDESWTADGRPADDGWALLDNMRRRLDDQVAQTRKTQAQVTQLAESIAALVDVQRKRSRWLNINSFAAYVIFTILLGAAFYFLYQRRAGELIVGRDRAVSERDAAVRRADDASTRTVARDSASAKAWDAYQLIAAGKREDVAKRIAELRDAPLSKLEREILTERAKQADVVLVDGALKAAAASFKAGRYADVIAPLDQALAVEREGPRAAQMHYLLGIALSKAGELDKAIAHLHSALDLDVADADARFQLASALDRAGQWGKARVEYDRFATAHPESGLAMFAMRRSATLARMPAVAPPAGQPAAVVPAVPAAPPPAAVPKAPPAPKPAPAAPAPKPANPVVDPFAAPAPPPKPEGSAAAPPE